MEIFISREGDPPCAAFRRPLLVRERLSGQDLHLSSSLTHPDLYFVLAVRALLEIPLLLRVKCCTFIPQEKYFLS